MRIIFLLLVFAGLGTQMKAQDRSGEFKAIVDSVFKEHPEMVGVLVHIEAPGQHISWSYTAGKDGKNSDKALHADQPLLIASNTKTYIAASILRLMEKKMLDINQPVRKLLTEQSQKVLTGAGYQLDSINVRHLLSHTSGIRDYVDEGYFQFISNNKKYHWTREEQVERTGKLGGPLGEPGALFRYADINYVLLSEVLEHFTKEPFYVSVRKLLNYKDNQLKNTWFIQLEKQPVNTLPLVNQCWTGHNWEIKDLDPSWDLYGGGGMASNVTELAAFYQLLFNGKIIKNKDILQLIVTDVPPNLEINYCLGVRKIKVGELTGYNHGGGLGTDVTYFPKLNATISIAVVEAEKRVIALQIRDLLATRITM